MDRRLPRTLSVLLLIVVFVHSYAWDNLQSCPGDWHDRDPAALDHHDDQETGQVLDHFPYGSPTIHCAPVDMRLSPVERAFTINVTRPRIMMPLQASLSSDETSLALGNHLWLEALFKYSTAPFALNLSRHLILSVLRI